MFGGLFSNFVYRGTKREQASNKNGTKSTLAKYVVYDSFLGEGRALFPQSNQNGTTILKDLI